MGVPVAARHVIRRRRRPRAAGFDPLGSFSWKAAFWAEDPLWTPPVDGGAVSGLRNGGSTRTEGAYLSSVGLTTPAATSNRSSVPDAANLDITGDITLVAHVAPDDWTPAAQTAFVSKASLSSVAYVLTILTDGTVQLYTTADGSTPVTGTSTAATGFTDGTAHWVAATLDVDNGAGGRDYTFWTSADGVTWSQLGSTVTEAATTSIASNTADVQSPGAINQGVFPFAGVVKGYQVWSGASFTTSGPGGTKVLDVDFTGRSDTNRFECSTGQTVTVLNSLDARQDTGSKQPAYRASVAALNGRPAVQGDGVDDFLRTAAWTSALSQPFSVVLVLNKGGTGSEVFLDGVSNLALVGSTVTGPAWDIHYGAFRAGGTADTDPHLLVALTGGTDTLDVDGQQVISVAAGSNAQDGVTLFASAAGNNSLGGHIAFAGVFDGDITAEANWPRFVAWVESHYGITVAA